MTMSACCFHKFGHDILMLGSLASLGHNRKITSFVGRKAGLGIWAGSCEQCGRLRTMEMT